VLDDDAGKLTAQDFDLGHRPIPAEFVGPQAGLAPIASAAAHTCSSMPIRFNTSRPTPRTSTS
jgi:hypothetical protein